MDRKQEIKTILKKRALKKSIEDKNKNKNLLNLSEDAIKSQITKDIEARISEYTTKMKELFNENIKIDDNERQKKKKYYKEKLRKLKKTLGSQEDVNHLLKMKKQVLRKMKSSFKKIESIEEKEKKKKVTCFFCRKNGHTVTECKEKQEKMNICFNCGSDQHNVHTCDKPVDYSNMPFASCFICKKEGHLSSYCTESNKGIYVKGGNCFVCQSTLHLAKDCPEKRLEIQNIKEQNKIAKQEKHLKIYHRCWR